MSFRATSFLVFVIACAIGLSSAAVAADDAGRAAGEPGGMAWAREFFAGIEPGDLAAVIARLFEYGKPYYRTLRRLRRVARRLEKRSRG